MFVMAPVILAALPAAFEFDFGALAGVKPPYEYTLVLRFKGEPDLKIPFTFGGQFTPEELATSLSEALKDPRWKIKQSKARVVIAGYDEVGIAGASVEGTGPRPLVRRIVWTPLIGGKKKQ